MTKIPAMMAETIVLSNATPADITTIACIMTSTAPVRITSNRHCADG